MFCLNTAIPAPYAIWGGNGGLRNIFGERSPRLTATKQGYGWVCTKPPCKYIKRSLVMNKRITSLLLCFVMIVTMLATAVPIFAASTDSCVYTIEADKTTAHPGDTITFTIYMQQKGNMLGLEGTLVIPAGLTFVEGSGKLTDGIKDTLGWDAVDWTPESNILNGYGSENYTSEEKLALMKFQCTVDNNAESKDYTVKLDDYLAANETGDPKEVSLIPATVTVTAAPKPATGITLNTNNLALVEEFDDTLIATVTPSDSTDTVVWSSDNTSVATVDNTGKVTAVAAGTAKITATAGTKSATCKVTVICRHNHTTVPAKASDCTNRGWDEYMVCSKCNALQKPTGEILSGIPYRPLDTNAHDFDTTTWGYKGADGHAYTCTRNSEHHDTVYPHNPDRTAPTETEPQTCTQCGYVIAAATGHIHANHLTPVAAKAATCTEAGNTAYYKCSCGKLFVDGTASVEATATGVVLPASGHSYTVQNSDDAHKRSTASDCREYDTYWYTCANDASHNAKDDTNATDKYYTGSRGAHAYSKDWTACGESGHAHKCLYDDSTNGLTNHRPDRAVPTETEAVKCLDCDYVIEAQLGHTHNFNQQNTDSKFKTTDATCTKPATYYYSCTCGEKGTKTFEYGSALDHTEGTAWEKNENYHWHICTVAGCGVVIESSKAAHTPDKTGGATYDYPILCSECGYVMEAQLEDSDVRIEVPFKLTVAKTGEKDPSAVTFKFALSDFGAPVEIKIVTETVATDGAKTYEGSFVFTVKKSELGNLSEGFVLSQVKGDAEGWTYDETAYRVVPASGDEESIGTFRFFKVDAEDGDNGSETVMFTNSYNAKADAPKPDGTTKPDDTSKKDTETSPKTGDNSMLTLWVALLFVSGAALTGTTLYSRKKRTYNR